MTKRLLALLLCAAMLLSLAACGKDTTPETTLPPETEAPTTAPTEPAAELVYAEAKAKVAGNADQGVYITEARTIRMGGESYLLESKQELRYTGMGTDQVQVSLTEELEMGDSYDKFKEFYADGTLYTTIYNKYNFRAPMDASLYTGRLIPVALLDESLYSDITLTQDGEDTLILFEGASEPESWAMPAGAQFHSAKGSALVNQYGNLDETTYTIEYTYGSSHIVRSIIAVPAVDKMSLTAPDPASYTEVSSIDALRLYDTALLYLYNANAVTTNLTEAIVSQAASCVLQTQKTVDYYGTGADHVAKADYAITIQQSGATDSYAQTELYRDGTYTMTPQGGEAQTDNSVDATVMYNYCQGFLSENIVALDYVENITTEHIGGTVYLELDFTEEYGDHLCAYASSTLFEDENLLTDLATASTLTDCSGYMALDYYTGMPTAVGILYSASHTIDGVEYPLTLQADQSFYLASQTAYKTITGESLPETAPEAAATPLFYKVTGTDGQEMYLLGTIHVGDEATGFLPQEIYDALDRADALAVEVDLIAFEEQIASDPTLAAQALATYIYADGSLTRDHLDQALYEQAVKLLKASGNYTAATEMMKPSVWQNTLSNFYIRQGYGLQSEKGVDMRLLKLAKEKGKTILEVESGLFQFEMLSGYSDPVQAFLLEDTLSGDYMEYYTEVAQLYELWCAGDEAALREAMVDDTSDLTAEELALYEEYNKAMITDRNEAMLKVAIGYLESGDTVFYAVGLAHLLAGNGLVDALREAGYTVELVTFA